MEFMLDPFLTNVLRRRIGASVVDLGIVGFATAAAGFLTAEKFTPETVDPSTNAAIWSSSDHARLQELSLDSLNRATTIGDTQYIWTKSSLQLLGAVALAFSIVVFILIPILTQSSIGQRLFKLRVSNTEGKTASAIQHIVRGVIGLIDLVPFVIPGLLGWIVASRGGQKQRIGDLAAGTTVVDRDGAVRLMTEDEVGQRGGADNSGVSNLDDSMVDLNSRLFPSPSADEVVQLSDADLANLDVQVGGPSAAPPHVPDLALASVPLSDLGLPDVGIPINDLPDVGIPDLPTGLPADLHAPDIESPDLGVPEVTLPDFLNPANAPQRNKQSVSLGDLADESAAWTPAAEPLSRLADAMDPVQEGMPESVSGSRPLIDDSTLPPPPLHRSTTWSEPVAEPAPVWVPDAAELVPEVQPVEAAVPEVAMPEVAMPEVAMPEVAEDPAALIAEVAESTEATVSAEVYVSADVEQGVAATGDGSTEPEWSEEWQAWIYWDAAHSTWLRHDVASDTWIPLS